ncbi:hypothetical protein HDU88_007993 [Geranomyces variabilis]|nr:hypothetical protein HDU88_007993 [Geranomyces variabilis]
MQVISSQQPSTPPTLAPEVWRIILRLIVNHELATLPPSSWNNRAFRQTPLVPHLLPICANLRAVARSWRSVITALCTEARSASFTVSWNAAEGRFNIAPANRPLPSAFSLDVNLSPAIPCGALETLLAEARNVRRLRVRNASPNTALDLFSRLCPAVITLQMGSFARRPPVSTNQNNAQNEQGTLNLRVMEAALTRWHDAGFGGLVHVIMPLEIELDDRFALQLAKSCPGLQTFLDIDDTYTKMVKQDPKWSLSEKTWDTWVDSLDTWSHFDWALVSIPHDQPEELPRRMMAFARRPKPHITDLKIGNAIGSSDGEDRVLTRDALTAVLKACPGLIHLTIFGDEFIVKDDVFDGLFTTLATHCPNLRSLNMTGIEQSGYGPTNLLLGAADFGALARMPHLETILLTQWKDMTPQALLQLMHVPASLVQRRSVKIRNTQAQCPAHVLVAFMDALVAQCDSEAAAKQQDTAGAPGPATLSVTADGAALHFEMAWEADEDAYERVDPTVKTLMAHDATPRRFRCTLDDEELVIRADSAGWRRGSA